MLQGGRGRGLDRVIRKLIGRRSLFGWKVAADEENVRGSFKPKDWILRPEEARFKV